MDNLNRSIQERLTLIEKKIDHIYKALNLHENEIIRPSLSIDIDHIDNETKTKVTETKTQDSLKDFSSSIHSSSSNLLPILAVICFVMAGVFIVKLALDSGWLTPIRQWALLSLFGGSLCTLGIGFTNIDKKYRSYLGSAGIIVLYLSAFSSNLYFQFFSPILAQVLGCLISFLCFYLFTYYQEESFIILSAIGTYISPILLGKTSGLLFNSGFFIIWATIFSLASSYLKNRSLSLIGSYLALAIYLYLNLHFRDPDSVLIMIIIQSAQFVIYALGIFHFSVKDKTTLTYNESMSYLPILLFFYSTLYYLINLYNPIIAPWISLGFCAFIYLLYWKAKLGLKNLESQSMVYIFMGVILFHSGYLQLVPANGKPWLLPLILLGMYIRDRKEKFAKISTLFHYLFSSIALIEFLKICFYLIVDMNTQNILPAVSTITLGFFYYSKLADKIKDKESLFLNLINILSIIVLYRIGYNYGSLAVSFLWGTYSITVLIIGYVKKNVLMAKSSLIALTITSMKALIYDISNAPSTIRITSLILTGAVLYGAGYFFRKIDHWKK